MAKRGEKLEKSFDRLSEKQLDIYATELQQHYHEERRLRRELETRNYELEQRVNELMSLNRLVQKFMAQSFEYSNMGSSFSPVAENSDADSDNCPQDPANNSGKEDLPSLQNDDLSNSGDTASETTA